MPVNALMLMGVIALHSTLSEGDWPLTPLDANTRTLEDHRVYYVSTNVTYQGVASTNRQDCGESALALAQNATTYIYIPEGRTLKCVGGDGCAAQVGEGPRSPISETRTLTEYGVSVNFADFKPSEGAAGGQGGSGGGAGIHVPKGSTLVVFGAGELIAQGGKGGAGSAGERGTGESGYVAAAWCNAEDAPITSETALKSYKSNICDAPDWSGSSEDDWACLDMNGLPTSGGGGGGGAGGGGAAIGTPGASGMCGQQGGKFADNVKWSDHFSSDYTNDCFIASVSGTPATNMTNSAAESGIVYLKVARQTLTGGVGGVKGTTDTTAVTNLVEFTAWDGEFDDPAEEHLQALQFVEGANGGGGGAGGNGAAVGFGGAGGAGGGGGSSGSMTCRYSTFWKEVVKRDLTPMAGDSGLTATNGTEKVAEWASTLYPYNHIDFGNGASTNYLFSQGSVIAIPQVINNLVGAWKVDAAAETLPGFPVDSTAFTTNGPSFYEPDLYFAVGTNTYGDVRMATRFLEVMSEDGKVAIGIDRSSDFFLKYLKSQSLSEMETWLDGEWQGDRRWLAYVLGMDLDRKLITDVVRGTNGVDLIVKPMAVATTNSADFVALNPPTNSLFNAVFQFYGSPDLTQPIGEWTPEELVGPSGAVGLKVDTSKSPLFFWRLKASARSSLMEKGG